MIDTGLRAISRLVTRRPRIVVGLALALTFISLHVGAGVPLRSDLSQILPENGSASRSLRDFLSRFATGDELLISISVVRSGMESGQSEGEKDLELLDDAGAALSARLRATGLFRRAADRLDEAELLSTWRFGLDYLPALVDPDRHAELAGRLSRPAMRAALRETRRRLSEPAAPWIDDLVVEDPLGLGSFLPVVSEQGVRGLEIDLVDGLFLSKDRRFLLVIAQPVRPPFDIEFSRRLMRTVWEEIGAVQQEIEPGTPAEPRQEQPRLDFSVAGGYPIATADEAMLRRDMLLTAGVSLAGVLLMFWIVFRQPAALAIAALPLGMSVCWSLGLAAVAPGHLNAITVGFAAILFGLGDDSALHLYNRFADERARGLDPAAAVAAAVERTGPAILAANMTTGITFGLLCFTSFPALADLGLLALYGIASITVAMLTVLPALLLMASRRNLVLAGDPGRGLNLQVPGLDALIGQVMGHPRRWLAAGALGALLALASVASLSFDFDLRRLRDPSSAAQRDEKAFFERFGGTADADFLILNSPSPDTALGAVRALRPVLEESRARGEIAGFNPPNPLLLPLEAQRRAVEACRERALFRGASVRLRDALVAEGFRAQAFEPALRRLERWEAAEKPTFSVAGDGSELPAWFTEQHFRFTPETVFVAVGVSRVPGATGGRFPERLRAQAAGLGFGLASLDEAVRETQGVVLGDFRALGVAAPLLVLAVVWTLLGRSARSLLALLPMAGGVLAALALAAALKIPIGTLTLIVTPLLFGVGVDYGIYVVHRWMEGGAAASATDVSAAGRTVVMTSATTFVAFASLGLADFRGLREIGVLAAGGITAAVGTALIILPATLAMARRRPGV